jgi:hypothetical protein
MVGMWNAFLHNKMDNWRVAISLNGKKCDVEGKTGEK